MKLVPLNAEPEQTDRVETIDEIKLGQWYWLKTRDRDDEPVVKKLVCVIHVGSNYAEVQTAGGNSYGSRTSWRVHFNEWDALCEHETDPAAHIRGKITHHQESVRELLAEIQRVTVSLGIVSRQAITDQAAEPQEQALAAVSSTTDVEAHKQALIVAKKETLPGLFKRVEAEHTAMAVWMQAETLPARAEFDLMKQSIASIDDRIFTVELYAGLVEKLEQIRDGKPAPNDTKVSLFQRRHYMDEECLANYEAGGMDFSKIADFDRWLCKPENLSRILPMSRSIVSFQVRRKRKEREGFSLSDWIRILDEEKADKWTFLYIRNGEQVWRMYTEIEFQEQLFPDPEHEALLGAHTGPLWISTNKHEDEIITDAVYQGLVTDYKTRKAEWPALKRAWTKAKAEYARAMEIWNKLPAEQKKIKEAEQPRDPRWDHDRWGGHWGPEEPSPPHFEKLTPDDSVHYDDAMRKIAKMTAEHNRIATVLQGLLDRSPCLHPHPPWRIWTPDGFKVGIDLIYDDSRGLTSGDPPDFEAYREQLNRSLKVGSICVGQEDAWQRAEADKYNAAQNRSWRTRSRGYEPTHHTPYGNPGPGLIAKVVAIGRNGDCIFEWKRERQRAKRYRWGAERSEDDDELTVRFRCPRSKLMNVSAYTPGDFRLFYADPRTRADYIQWAPFLLAAEDFHVKGKAK